VSVVHDDGGFFFLLFCQLGLLLVILGFYGIDRYLGLLFDDSDRLELSVFGKISLVVCEDVILRFMRRTLAFDLLFCIVSVDDGMLLIDFLGKFFGFYGGLPFLKLLAVIRVCFFVLNCVGVANFLQLLL